MRFTPLLRSAAESSTSSSGLPHKARIAIIGAGPSGFYAASRLLSRIPSQQLRIDIFDRLPVPHGLVRYGVAPDHPDVKNVENKFAAVSQDPRLRFAGNANVVHSGSSSSSAAGEAVEVPLEELSRYYTHILFSYGASTGRSLGIPGEVELDNIYSALQFVNWYNGHPSSHSSSSKFDLSNTHHLTVIGAGNVALDVARIVLRCSTPFLESSPRVTSNKAPGLAALEETDVPEPVLAELGRCKVNEVDVFARRGPAQLAFTNKEVREMLSLEGIALRPPPAELLDSALAQLETLAKSEAADPARAQEIASEVRVKKRLLSLLAKGSKTKPGGEGVKQWGLNFFHSPARFLPKGNSKAVGQVEWNRTTLQSGRPTAKSLDATDPRKAAWSAGSTDSVPAATGQTVITDTDMVVSSVGYQSEPLASSSSSSQSEVVREGRLVALPFDARRKIVPNQAGRVLDPITSAPIPGAYVSGWLARGPTGVIATTMMDAYSVADLILDDLHSAAEGGREVEGDLLEKLHREGTRKVVGFDGWRRIDEEEKRRGQKLGKIREKILTVKEMLDVVG
ncbi:NAD(P)-binding domain protein [Kalmanozyma brasiliensis GHG001]|uniref:NADPH:adrenodoxin oxidoreductase, mitochondrial n=1 Tax=Kalmanozyma brasiliensis (strain GHG001) TaxID=1365824 RepID=V5EVR0_KALBG|nr:NAD(P)-binding domain protein [Kalmanozyma brasiliensis GHG001]EST06349.1 NAD(P)-binding domain protein [Kalmanozyma brasiliensis GHG001]